MDELIERLHSLEYSVFEHCGELLLDFSYQNYDVKGVQLQILPDVHLEIEFINVHQLTIVQPLQYSRLNLHKTTPTSFFYRNFQLNGYFSISGPA